MRPIPLKLRQELEKIPWMKICLLVTQQRKFGACSGRIRNPEWHHVWIYAGKQINEGWAILPACTYHHDAVNKDRSVKEEFEIASLEMATESDLAKYPKKDWAQLKKYLWQQNK